MKNIDQEILKYLKADGYKPSKAAAVATRLKIPKKGMPKFKKALARLISTGLVREGKKGRLRAKMASGTMEGVMKRTGSGAGYVIPHDATAGDRSNDVYVSHRDVRDAHTGDEVLVTILDRRKGGKQRCGRVTEVLVRATNTFVGTYYEEENLGLVRVDGKTFTEPVAVGDPGAKGVQAGDKVVIEMLRFPLPHLPGEAVLTKVLGPKGEPGIDELSIIHEFGLPQEFSDEVIDDANLQAEQFDETQHFDRRDLTKELIITIDPADARDFDDAISLKQTKDGHWHLGVHIADVAHFVQPGSVLDQEAKMRGTSIYLPGRVIPMLPEVISNGLASLQKGRVRYTKTAFIEFTAEGIPVHTEFANTVIKVTRRFAYEEVMPIIENPEKFKSKVSAKVCKLLADMLTLAMKLRARRFAAGSLEMGLPEVKIDFDDDNRVIGAHATTHDESHQMIEEFMLAANIAVATELNDRDITFLRRTHGDPDHRKLKQFGEFVKALGFDLENPQSRPALQKLLQSVQGEPAEPAINYALLRSMKQAEYASINMGHYALAFDHYCHFTSPIRRYPDLTIHRIIDDLVKKKPGKAGLGEAETTKLGISCSKLERRAQAAERELTSVKLLTYMEKLVGEELDAVITSVEQFGIFCRGVDVPVEGLIHISALDNNDYFDFEQQTYSLVGRRRGKKYQLGDRIRVTVAHVDVDRRELDFRIATTASSPSPTKRQPKKKPTPKKAKPKKPVIKKTAAKGKSISRKKKKQPKKRKRTPRKR